MGSEWWWNRAPAGQRLIGAILGLLVELALIVWAILAWDDFFSHAGVLAWFWVLAAPFLALFFLAQALRA